MQQNEKLSAYIDDELKESNFTEALCSSSKLQQQWKNYHIIRSVMRGDEIMLGSDFSLKMEKLLENEQMDTHSNQVQKKRKINRWLMPVTQLGIAATVCFMVVTGVNLMQNQDSAHFVQEQQVLQTQPFTHSIQPVSLNLQDEIKKIEEEKKQKEQEELTTLEEQRDN